MDGHAVSCIPAVADCYGALALELGGVPTQALAVIVGTGLREQAVGDFGDVLAASTREVGAGMHAEFATAVEPKRGIVVMRITLRPRNVCSVVVSDIV